MKKKDSLNIQLVPSTEVPISLLLEADPSESKIREYLPSSFCYVAIKSGDIVGVYVLKALNQTTFELMNIAVKPDFQAKGIGSELLKHALFMAKHSGAWRMINFRDIEDAYFYVSSNQQFVNSAFINKRTGEIFYQSDDIDNDELLDNVDSVDFVEVPHQNDLELGKELVFEFVSMHLPEKRADVVEMFHARGAHRRFKSLLSAAGLLEEWEQFEDGRIKAALREWCEENGIQFKE